VKRSGRSARSRRRARANERYMACTPFNSSSAFSTSSASCFSVVAAVFYAWCKPRSSKNRSVRPIKGSVNGSQARHHAPPAPPTCNDRMFSICSSSESMEGKARMSSSSCPVRGVVRVSFSIQVSCSLGLPTSSAERIHTPSWTPARRLWPSLWFLWLHCSSARDRVRPVLRPGSPAFARRTTSVSFPFFAREQRSRLRRSGGSPAVRLSAGFPCSCT